jgi:hypothetical protein
MHFMAVARELFAVVVAAPIVMMSLAFMGLILLPAH